MNQETTPITFTEVWRPGHPRARAPKAPSIAGEIWEYHRATIEHMYIKLGLKLEDVMLRMQVDGFSPTKRQYTKKLKEWGCKKYNIPSKDDTTSQSTPTTQDASPSSNTTPATDPMEVDTAPTYSTAVNGNIITQDHVHPATMICAEAVGTQPGTEPPADVKEAPDPPYVAVVHEREHSYQQSIDVDMSMYLMFETIPEERPGSHNSTDGLSSIEAASSRDYGSRSSANNSFDFSSGQPRTPISANDLQPVLVSGMTDVEGTSFPTNGSIDQDFPPSDTGNPNIADTPSVASPVDSNSLPQPQLVPSPEVTKKVSPAGLLVLVASDKVSGAFSEGDLSRIEGLAEIFEAVQSYEDAYQLRRLVLRQAIESYNCDKASADPRKSRVTNLIKNAKTLGAHKEAAASIYRTMIYRLERLPEFWQVFEWCVNALAEGEFWQVIVPVSSDIWRLAPSAAELEDVECTILFFYLWTQMQLIQDEGRPSASTSVRSHSACVRTVARVLDIPIAEVLSVAARFIMATDHGWEESASKETLARRALMKVRAVHHFTPSSGELMDNYAAAARRKGTRFSTENYAVLVRGAIRDMVERSFHLELEVTAIRDPRLQNRASQLSMTPSYSPTMLSTPRSSWSGFRSFKSAGRRASRFWVSSNNSSKNDIQSSSSSRRLSIGSIKSVLTFQSSTPSSRDVIMEDDSEL